MGENQRNKVNFGFQNAKGHAHCLIRKSLDTIFTITKVTSYDKQ